VDRDEATWSCRCRAGGVGALLDGRRARGDGHGNPGERRVHGRAGEANDVTIEREGPDLVAASWLVSDVGAGLTPFALCTPLAARSARCPYSLEGMRSAVAQLGDGDDRLTAIMPGEVLVTGITAVAAPATIRSPAATAWTR
jgi:hypothetical protein